MVREPNQFMFKLNNRTGLILLFGWMFIVNAYEHRAQTHNIKREEFKVVEKLPDVLPVQKPRKKK
jgi:hypothetical protein